MEISTPSQVFSSLCACIFLVSNTEIWQEFDALFLTGISWSVNDIKCHIECVPESIFHPRKLRADVEKKAIEGEVERLSKLVHRGEAPVRPGKVQLD